MVSTTSQPFLRERRNTLVANHVNEASSHVAAYLQQREQEEQAKRKRRNLVDSPYPARPTDHEIRQQRVDQKYHHLRQHLDSAAEGLADGQLSRHTQRALADCVAICLDLRPTCCVNAEHQRWFGSIDYRMGNRKPNRSRHNEHCNPPVAEHIDAALDAAGYQGLRRSLNHT